MSENQTDFNGGAGELDNTFARPLKDEDIFAGNVPQAANKLENSFIAPPAADAGKAVLLGRNLLLIQTALAVCIILTASAVCWLLFAARRPAQVIINSNSADTQAEQPASAIDKETAEDAVSLYSAKQYYAMGDYKKASAAFKKLRSGITTAENQYISDYLLLCSAVCNLKDQNPEQANEQFQAALRSDFDFVRLFAGFYLCRMELSQNHFSSVAALAYQCLAILELLDEPSLTQLRSDFEYFAAIAASKTLTALSDLDKDIPTSLYQAFSCSYDVIKDIDENRLKELFASGGSKFQTAVLWPNIEKNISEQNDLSCSAVAYGCSIEELMSRFASQFSMELSWDITGDLETIRQRAVRLYMHNAPVEDFVRIACGSVSLAADFDGGKIKIYNPDEYKNLDAHLSALNQHCCNLWQKFIVSRIEDKRLPTAYFMLGYLHSCSGDSVSAINNFKLLAVKYPRSSLSAYALFECSKLKIAMKDFSGAKKELSSLAEQYPDCAIIDRAYILLAEITASGGNLQSASSIFARVYNLNYSQQSRQIAAQGAAEAFYKLGDYESAAAWAKNFISSVQQNDSSRLSAAYLLAGEIYLANNDFENGCTFLRAALSPRLGREQYQKTVFALLDGYAAAGRYVEAMETIESVDSWQFSEQQFISLLLAKSRIYRNIGLYSKAIAVLADRVDYVSDKQLRASLLYEIALSKISAGYLNSAYNNLTEAAGISDAGRTNDEITFSLADLCSRLGRDQQCENLCKTLISSCSSPEIKRQAKELLAETYRRQNDYDKAILVLASAGDKKD